MAEGTENSAQQPHWRDLRNSYHSDSKLAFLVKQNWLSAILPTLIFVVAYGGTTVFAATLYMIPGGDEYLQSRIGPMADGAIAVVGTPIYLALLYLPLVITPFVALATMRLLSPVASRIPLPTKLQAPRISRVVLWALVVFSTGYCLHKLQQFGALDLGLISSGSHVEKTIRRMALLKNLGFVFFAFAYGINVILPILAFLSYDMQGRRKSDFLLFILSFAAFVFIIAMTYSKAQILIYLILAICAFILAKSKIRHIFAVGAVSLAAFFLIGYMVSATPEPQGIQVVTPNAPIVTPNVLEDTAAEQVVSGLIGYAANIGGAAVHRMAVAAAYFPVLFADPEERCGIQGGLVRQLLNLPPPACVLPIKAFKAIYPEGSFTEGMQPAPASLSAYAEIGLSWSLTVMTLSGIALGVLGVIGALGSGPLYAGFIVAACSFGYYLAQVPFVASFTYPHGLIVFMIPIGLLLLVVLFGHASTPDNQPTR